jgi:hypothetical protein
LSLAPAAGGAAVAWLKRRRAARVDLGAAGD